MAVFMERQTPKGSRNSGLPGSKAEPDETARGRTGAKGKGPKARAAGDAEPSGRREADGPGDRVPGLRARPQGRRPGRP